MHREKFPEKVPFRLTRMLTNAMEVSGIEGNFRCTCERVMTVLRDNRDSLIAMLEAFVHDPLISWRLLGVGGGASGVGDAGADAAEQQPQPQQQPQQEPQEEEEQMLEPTRVRAPPASQEQQEQQEKEREQAEGAVGPGEEALPSQEDGQQDAVAPRVPSPAVTGGPSFGPDALSGSGGSSVVTTRMRAATHDRFAALPTVSESVGSGGLGEGEEGEEEEEEATARGGGGGGGGGGGRGHGDGEAIRAGAEKEAAAAAGDFTAPTTTTGASAILGEAGSLGAATSLTTSATARRARMADLHLEIGSLAASISANKTRFSSSVAMPSRSLAQSRRDHRSVRERELVHAVGPEGLEAPAEMLNAKAIAVVRRVQDKLTGLDFDNDEALDVAEQVERLILQATSKENLCQLFTGWCVGGACFFFVLVFG